MANHPDPHKPSEQPDDNKKNPPLADETSQSGMADLHGKEPSPSEDSFIDLGMPGGPADPFASAAPSDGHDPSDMSIVEWAALVEETPPGEPAPPLSAKFDRPSDQDWAGQAANIADAKPTRPPTDSVVNISDLFADPAEIMADAPSKSEGVAVPPIVPAEPPPHDVPVLTDDSSLEHDAHAADLEIVRQTFNLDELDSKKNLLSPSSGDSGILAQPVSLAPSEPEDVFVEEVDLASMPADTAGFSSSGVDLQQLDSGSFVDIVQEEVAEANAGTASSVDLGSTELPKMRKELSPSSLEQDDAEVPLSGRDLIAEAVESGVDMRQPLMEIVEEALAEPADEDVLEANEVIEDEPSSSVNLGAAVETETLNREELQALLASQELGAAADQPVTPSQPTGEPPPEEPAKPGARKTIVAGRGPIRTTQMQDITFNEEALEPIEAVEEAATIPETVAEAGELVQEQIVSEIAAPDSGVFVEQEVAAPEVVGDEKTEAVVREAAPTYGDEVQEIILSEDHPTIDSRVNLDQLAQTGSASGIGASPSGINIDELLADSGTKQAATNSGVLLETLAAQEKAEVDPEEVQLGESSADTEALSEEAAAAEMETEPEEPAQEKPAKPVKPKSRAMPFVGGGLIGTLVGVGACVALYFGGLLGGMTAEQKAANDKQAAELVAVKQQKVEADTKLDALNQTIADKNAAADKQAADLLALMAQKAAADKKADGLNKTLADQKAAADKVATDLNQKLVDQKNDADKKVDGLNQKLADQKVEAEKNLAALDAKMKDQMKKADLDLTVANTKATKLETDLKTANDAAKDIRQELVKAKLVDDKADNVKVLQGLKEALNLAQMKDAQGTIRQLQKDIGDAQATLKERWEPKDMLAFWLPVLEDRTQKALTPQALQDAARVLKDPQATPEQKAKATALRGLALRNDENYAEAKTALEAAKPNLGTDKLWQTSVDAALKEVSNPTATYKASADKLRNQGDYEAAKAALTKALGTLPADKQGELLAERSLLALEALRAKGYPLPANDPVLEQARADAKKAGELGVAQGFYAAGRIAEETGQWAEAVTAYRKAVALHPDLDAQGSRFSVALARALLRSQDKAAAPRDNNIGRVPALEGGDPRLALAVLATLALQAPLLPPASQEEAMNLADKILAAKPGTVPFDVRAQAFAIKGLYTEALKTYAEGLRSQLKPEYFDGLMQLIENHPTLKRPESLKIANPLNAEKHYGAGLSWYYDRRYVNAEQEFLEAVKNDALDARYHYFLGLARLAQNKQDAYEDFAQGAKLELQNRPSRAAVSTALERVQGPARKALNDVRNQAR